MRYSVERRIRIYNDDHGYYWEVRPDPDGLGLEIVYNEGGGKDVPATTIPPEVAEGIAHALIEVAKALPEPA